MNLRVLREQKFLSQEKLAEMSGLSLRTIQRLEAGHRVSYASLRALAVTLEVDVDSLEQELYAMSRSAEEFVEIPTWVRLLDSKRWFGGESFSRRDTHVIEIFCLACAVGNFAGSFLTESTDHAKVFRNLSILTIACAYLVSAMIRLGDKYKLWSGAAAASPERQRTWRAKVSEYACMLVVGIVGTALVYWMVF